MTRQFLHVTLIQMLQRIKVHARACGAVCTECFGTGLGGWERQNGVIHRFDQRSIAASVV